MNWGAAPRQGPSPARGGVSYGLVLLAQTQSSSGPSSPWASTVCFRRRPPPPPQSSLPLPYYSAHPFHQLPSHLPLPSPQLSTHPDPKALLNPAPLPPTGTPTGPRPPPRQDPLGRAVCHWTGRVSTPCRGSCGMMEGLAHSHASRSSKRKRTRTRGTLCQLYAKLGALRRMWWMLVLMMPCASVTWTW